ncbi:uncharacterized protein LOC103312881 isoform X2 [Tribolium castaneum]|uniref:uncharacterized protein LOC103312881 isoform X2 n=1 Tax=Tribolium castaneum TaxID=7070 RepID=UPI00046BF080|nr:PREDICTED: uncharacterized protein LOC103312881 isoform X2 [Tribolium castaneum]|eukprot:XP_008192901.1 PREDICTED: uncharacterized protein LOC103312881 isoform X2 [Tribolium castaneum]
MAATENLKKASSRNNLVKSSSASPSISQSVRSQKPRTSKSSQSVITKNGSFSSAKDASLHSQQGSKTEKDKAKGDRCERGPDLYSRVLGHTADETILTGLQTVIDLCNKLRVCGDRDESGDEEPEREQDVPERDTPSVISAGFQIEPTMTAVASQTLPSNVVSNLMQTSQVDIAGPKPTMNTLFIQTSDTTLKSDAIQTTDPGVKYELVQTSSALLPIVKCPAVNSCMTQVDPITVCEQDSPGDHCIAPPEPPQKSKTCKCCKCSASTVIKKPSKPKPENGKRPCLCTNKNLSKCRCGKKDEVVEDKEPEEVRYAVTKISKFKEYTTFEVMKSTRHKPRQIPKGVEGVFVLKKKNDSSKNDLKRRSKSKSEVNGLNGLRSEESSRRQSIISETESN